MIILLHNMNIRNKINELILHIKILQVCEDHFYINKCLEKQTLQ